MRICRAHNLEESPASIITRTPDLFAPQSGVLTLVYCDLCLPEGVTPPPRYPVYRLIMDRHPEY